MWVRKFLQYSQNLAQYIQCIGQQLSWPMIYRCALQAREKLNAERGISTTSLPIQRSDTRRMKYCGGRGSNTGTKNFTRWSSWLNLLLTHTLTSNNQTVYNYTYTHHPIRSNIIMSENCYVKPPERSVLSCNSGIQQLQVKSGDTL